jgi:hypothetical protein
MITKKYVKQDKSTRERAASHTLITHILGYTTVSGIAKTNQTKSKTEKKGMTTART